MRTRRMQCSTLALAAIIALGGCATAPEKAEIDQRAAEIQVYTTDQSVFAKYDVVNRLWADSWRTAFVAPTYPTQEEALSALRSEAARLGANGLINVQCLDEARARWFPKADPPAFLCYGIAVRFT